MIGVTGKQGDGVMETVTGSPSVSIPHGWALPCSEISLSCPQDQHRQPWVAYIWVSWIPFTFCWQGLLVAHVKFLLINYFCQTFANT